jgi:hypothetical protein
VIASCPQQCRAVLLYPSKSNDIQRSPGGPDFAVRHVLAIVVSLIAPHAVEAANIDVRQAGAVPVVMIEGDLELGDIEQFRNKVAQLSKATVAFRSDGGSLLAGIRIGMLIRVRNFTTVVPEAAQCASACAVAWLGGAHRFLGVGSKVGFHAAYVQKAGGTAESGPGNAVLGAYLDQIGLPEDAIVYITQASPSSMKWLSIEEAAQHGIDVELLPSPNAVPISDPTTTASSATPDQPQTSLAGRATGLVLALAARWSEPNAEMLAALDALYADKVFYHGKLAPRQAVVLEKRRFAERWPQRSYKIKPHSVTASCNAAAEMCRVQGVMERELSNPTTNTKSHDIASFDYSIARVGEGLKIAAETSAVSKLSDPSDGSNPLTTVQRGLEHLLAQVARIRPSPPPDGQAKPSSPNPH